MSDSGSRESSTKRLMNAMDSIRHAKGQLRDLVDEVRNGPQDEAKLGPIPTIPPSPLSEIIDSMPGSVMADAEEIEGLVRELKGMIL